MNELAAQLDRTRHMFIKSAQCGTSGRMTWPDCFPSLERKMRCLGDRVTVAEGPDDTASDSVPQQYRRAGGV